MSEQWWKSAVVYQVYPRSFADADGDGIGDLRGIIGKVDYLRELGVDAVWLSPVYASPQDDNGYDISDYRAIEPAFGTLDDFDELVAAFHAAGIRLIMDLVVNHTSDEHAWFEESRSSRDSSKRDWYIWRDRPNNWESFFSGSTWEFDEATEQYYLHLFSRKQPDLNWENPEVREAVYGMMRWWLDRGVDGFRMDVINLISKADGLPDGTPLPGRELADGFPHYGYGPRIHDYLQEMHREVFASREGAFVTVGEMPGSTTEQAKLYTDPARGELDMIFQFEHVGVDHGTTKFEPVPLDLVKLKQGLARWQTALAETGWNSLYWNNHDQPRVVSRFGDDGVHREQSAKALGLVLHLMRGTPYVYQGEELGMTNAGFASIDQYRDIETLNYWSEAVATGYTEEDLLPGVLHSSRDNARTPMQWTPGGNAGFTSGTPWIGLAPNWPYVNAEAERADPHSVFHFYRRLIELRHAEPIVVDGDFELLLPDDPAVFAYRRTLHDGSLTVVANWSTGVVPLPAGIHGDVVLANDQTAGDDELGPWEARVYRS
jgi:oligo-1,6-glucosidase